MMSDFGVNTSSIVPLITTYGTRIIGVIVLLLVAWILASWSRRAMERSFNKVKFDPTLSKFFSNATRWTIFVVAVLACLGIFGVQTTSFAAILAAGGLAVGLAFQGTLSNFSSGVMLLVFRPFKVGDVVSVAGELGKVVEIELFTTKLDTPDNRRIILPNSSVFGTTIQNITHHKTRRVDVSVGTVYTASLDETRKVMETAANSVTGILQDPPKQVVLLSLGNSSIDWAVRVWCKTEDYWTVRDATTRAVKLALDKANIGIPFPQMDIHLSSDTTEKVFSVKDNVEVSPPPTQ